MVHKCYIDGSSAACFEHDGELWVKEFADGNQKEGRTYPVKFCPQCGHTINPLFTTQFSDIHTLKSQVFMRNEEDDILQKFSSSLANTVRDMNQNINAIKAFMVYQNIQNQCFIDNEMELIKRISKLEATMNGN